MDSVTVGTRGGVQAEGSRPGLIRVDEGQVKAHLSEVVRGTVDETLNALLDAEVDRVCRARRHERSPDR